MEVTKKVAFAMTGKAQVPATAAPVCSSQDCSYLGKVKAGLHRTRSHLPCTL